MNKPGTAPTDGGGGTGDDPPAIAFVAFADEPGTAPTDGGGGTGDDPPAVAFADGPGTAPTDGGGGTGDDPPAVAFGKAPEVLSEDKPFRKHIPHAVAFADELGTAPTDGGGGTCHDPASVAFGETPSEDKQFWKRIGLSAIILLFGSALVGLASIAFPIQREEGNNVPEECEDGILENLTTNGGAYTVLGCHVVGEADILKMKSHIVSSCSASSRETECNQKCNDTDFFGISNKGTCICFIDPPDLKLADVLCESFESPREDSGIVLISLFAKDQQDLPDCTDSIEAPNSGASYIGIGCFKKDEPGEDTHHLDTCSLKNRAFECSEQCLTAFFAIEAATCMCLYDSPTERLSFGGCNMLEGDSDANNGDHNQYRDPTTKDPEPTMDVFFKYGFNSDCSLETGRIRDFLAQEDDAKFGFDIVSNAFRANPFNLVADQCGTNIYEVQTEVSENSQNVQTYMSTITEFANSRRNELTESLSLSVEASYDALFTKATAAVSASRDMEQINIMNTEGARSNDSRVLTTTGVKRIAEVAIVDFDNKEKFVTLSDEFGRLLRDYLASNFAKEKAYELIEKYGQFVVSRGVFGGFMSLRSTMSSSSISDQFESENYAKDCYEASMSLEVEGYGFTGKVASDIAGCSSEQLQRMRARRDQYSAEVSEQEIVGGRQVDGHFVVTPDSSTLLTSKDMYQDGDNGVQFRLISDFLGSDKISPIEVRRLQIREGQFDEIKNHLQGHILEYIQEVANLLEGCPENAVPYLVDDGDGPDLRCYGFRSIQGVLNLIDYCWDVDADTSNLYMGLCDAQKPSQIFHFDPASKFIKQDDMCITQGNDNGVFMTACGSNNDNQKWRYNHFTEEVKPEGDDGMCLDMYPTDRDLYMYPCHGDYNQKFTFPKDFFQDSIDISKHIRVRYDLSEPNISYCLQSKVETAYGHTFPNVMAFPCDADEPRQRFEFDPFEREISQDGMCLDYHVSNTNDVLFRTVYLFPECHGGQNQKWYYDQRSGEVKSGYDETCLDMSLNSNGRHNLYMNMCHGRYNQKFVFGSDFSI